MLKYPNKNIEVLWVEEVNSTNDYIKLLSSDACLQVLAAYRQICGRGRNRKRWVSMPGENLTFSVKFEIPAGYKEYLFYVSKFSALAISAWLDSMKIPNVIKWPNDILVNRQKISGILIETVFKADGYLQVVVGIGINVNQIDFDGLDGVTSLAKITGTRYRIESLLDEFLLFFQRYWWLFIRKNFSMIEEEYHRRLGIKKGQEVSFMYKGSICRAKFVMIDREGFWVCRQGSREVRYAMDEIKMLG